ncbi:MAG: LPS-assembly lipoprotein [Sulfitobacter sp.]|jgi:LPS-assembly lipoprotein
MSLPKAKCRRFFLLAPLALAACGFQPVYGRGGNGQLLQNRVMVDAPNARNGYFLTREIEQQLGRGATPAYGLAVNVSLREERLAINRAGETTRYDLIGTVDFALRDLQTGQIVTSGKVDNFTGYSATGTTVATQASKQDAEKRLMVILAEQIITRLYAADLS